MKSIVFLSIFTNVDFDVEIYKSNSINEVESYINNTQYGNNRSVFITLSIKF